MGNKEFSEGVSSTREGTSLIKFPIVEEERVVFLYHMNITPRVITHMPMVINRAKISLGDNVKRQFSSIFSRTLLNISIDMEGNCSTLAFNVLISASVSLAKSDLYHARKLLTLVQLKL